MSTPYPPPDEYGAVPDHGGQPYGSPYAQGFPPEPGSPFVSEHNPFAQGPPFVSEHPFVPGPPFAQGPPQGVSGLAIASLVAAFLFPPLAIIFGHLALSQIESRNEGGRGIAVAGLVLGYLFTVLTIIGVIIAVVFLVALAHDFDEYRTRTAEQQPAVAHVLYVAADPSADVYRLTSAARLSVGTSL